MSRGVAPAHPGAPAAGQGLATGIVTDEGALQELEADWRALERRVPSAEFFSSFDWTWCWWRHFGAGERMTPAVIVARDGGRLAAVMPLAVFPAGPYRCAVLMGTGSGQYGDILVDPADARGPALHDALWASLGQVGADTFQADNVRADSALARFLATRSAHAGRAETSYQVSTRDFADFDAYMAERPARLRKNLRRRRRHLADDGPVSYEMIAEPAAIAEAVTSAVRLKRQWLAERGLHGRLLSRPGAECWLVDVARRAHAEGRLHFSVLRVGQRLVAAQIGFLSGERLVGYFAAFDVSYARHSVGKLHLEDHLRDIFASRLTLDLLPPADEYKREWGAAGVAARSYAVPVSPFGRFVTLIHNPRQRQRVKALYLSLPGALRAGLAASGLSAARRLRRLFDASSDPSRPEDNIR